MFRKYACSRIRIAVSILAAILLLTSSAGALALPAPHVAGNPDDYPVFDVTPSTVAPGREYAIVVLSHDPNKVIKDTTQLVAPGPITVTAVKVDSGNSLSARMTVPQDSPLGKYRFLLKETDAKDAKVIGIADIDVTVVQGPIPPGMEPAVDVMWSVMPSAIVRHNFGRQIANNYYGIQIRIGNDSGYDLQIAGIGFKLPANSGLNNRIPTNSYRATRGTLEREQEIGIRATVVNIVKSLGTLYTGFLPFWHMPNRRANANLAGAIFTGPFEAGLEAVFPDSTTRQLTRLDDQTLRDGLVVKNNTQVVTLAWVPKKLLNLSTDAGKNDLGYQMAICGPPCRPNAPNVPKDDRTPEALKPPPNADRNWSDDPQYVNFKLGELVLVGQQIAYINRVQVISTTTGVPVAPPPTVNGINPPTVEQNSTDLDLTIPGAYLDNATPILNDPDTNQPVSGVKFSAVSADSSGHILKAKITVNSDVPPKKYRLIVTTAGGSFEKVLEIIQAPPTEVSPVTYLDNDGHPPNEDATKDQSVKIKITGKNLKNAKISISKESQDKLDVKDEAANPTDRELTQTIVVPKGTKAGAYKLQVKNANPKAVPIPGDFTLNALPPSDVSEITYVDDGIPPKEDSSKDQPVKIKITGKHLTGAKILIPTESKGKLDLQLDKDGKDDAKGSDEELTQTIVVRKAATKNKYKLQVKNANPNPVAIPGDFTVAAKAQ